MSLVSNGFPCFIFTLILVCKIFITVLVPLFCSPISLGCAEGPRLHVVTADGALWVAGTTHKGLGADHLSKTMQPARDHLEFYRVGGAAADADAPRLFTGALLGRHQEQKSLMQFFIPKCCAT